MRQKTDSSTQPLKPHPLAYQLRKLIVSPWALLCLIACLSFGCQSSPTPAASAPVRSFPVIGWNILTNVEEEGMAIVEKLPDYQVNHLQLSHQIIMDLRHARDEKRRQLAQKLTREAKERGVPEVVVWDHALYYKDYYPARFRTGPDSTINLDNPAFWTWFKDDYREMLALLPEIDGLVLTFIETGARAEDQYSEQLSTPAQKLAAVLNAVAEVVVEEKGLKLYARTFAYNDAEYENIINCLQHVDNQDIVLMMKETPHDFFIPHPNNPLIGKIDRPTLVEFDLGNEFNGQGIIANTFPEVAYARWKDFRNRENVIGYVARVDRYGTTRSIGRPSEILPFTLNILLKEPDISVDEIYTRFITERYGKAALPEVKQAFELSREIIMSTFYTLGLNTADHSRLNFHRRSHYTRHNSGRWLEDKTVFIGHGVEKELHWFKDITNHLSPAKFKAPDFDDNPIELAEVYENNWLEQGERMNEEYLGHVVTEKAHGVELAQKALQHIEAAKPHLQEADYEDLYETFYRTLLTARIRSATAKIFFGYRIYARGTAFQTDYVKTIVDEGIAEVMEVAPLITDYPKEAPSGQWDWRKDGEWAMGYIKAITEGWEEFGEVRYPYELPEKHN
jgi:hypothetical protein